MTVGQAHQHWEALKADRSIERDEGGPASNRRRLAIPSFLVGKDVLEEKESHFTQQEIKQTSALTSQRHTRLNPRELSDVIWRNRWARRDKELRAQPETSRLESQHGACQHALAMGVHKNPQLPTFHLAFVGKLRALLAPGC